MINVFWLIHTGGINQHSLNIYLKYIIFSDDPPSSRSALQVDTSSQVPASPPPQLTCTCGNCAAMAGTEGFRCCQSVACGSDFCHKNGNSVNCNYYYYTHVFICIGLTCICDSTKLAKILDKVNRLLVLIKLYMLELFFAHHHHI